MKTKETRGFGRQRMSLTIGDYVIAFLSMSRNMRRNEQIWKDLKKKYKTISKGTYNTTLARLKKKELIVKLKNEWVLTAQGRKQLKRQQDWQPPSVNSKESLLVCFDIPETRKRERNWLREQLRTFSYHMIQKSIWRGPGPLPPGFYGFLKETGLLKMVHIFRLAPKQKVLQ